jgi:hypothetical protein
MLKGDKLAGWAIAFTLLIFVWVCWDPFMNNREEFLVTGSIILVVSAFMTLIVVALLSKSRPKYEEPNDSYNRWLDKNSRSIERLQDEEYSQDNWNSKVKKRHSHDILGGNLGDIHMSSGKRNNRKKVSKI